MSTEYVLKNTKATLEMVFSAGDADGAVTVSSTRADGTAGPGGAATDVGVGDYTFALLPQTELDSLVFTWAGTWGGQANSVQSFVEIVGGQLFTLAELRAFGDRAVSNTTAYTDAMLRTVRAEFVDLVWDRARVSFFPRYFRESLDGTNSGTLFLTRKRVTRIIACSVNGLALSAPEIALIDVYPTGRIERPTFWPFDRNNRENITIAYEYGYPTAPGDVKRAAMTFARYNLVSNDISDRMIMMSSDLGTFRFSMPGREYPTGIPLVDATLAAYDETEARGP